VFLPEISGISRWILRSRHNYESACGTPPHAAFDSAQRNARRPVVAALGDMAFQAREGYNEAFFQ
jgi:hypothetical protein